MAAVGEEQEEWETPAPDAVRPMKSRPEKDTAVARHMWPRCYTEQQSTSESEDPSMLKDGPVSAVWNVGEKNNQKDTELLV